MKTKNIYIFDEYISSHKNGIGTYLRELLYCLNSPEYNIMLIVFNTDAREFTIVEEKNLKKMLFPVLKGHFLFHVQVIDKFLRLFIKDDPNNVFLLNHSPCLNLIKSLKVNFPFSKIVFTIHDFGWTNPLMGDLNEIKRVIVSDPGLNNDTREKNVLNYFEEEKKMYRLADRTICLSRDSYTILRTVYKLDKNKISLIPNGLRNPKNVSKQIYIEEIRNSLNIRIDEKILVAIGRPTKQKGIFDLIKAMKMVLKETNQNVRLVIIGDANEQSFRELINAASPLATSVSFTGLLDRESIYKWISIADLGIIPSYYEQFGFVGVEMMMYGLPIVASDGLGVRNMFQDGVNAKIAKIGNRQHPEEYQNNLANSILALLNSPDTCKVLGSNARKRYEEKYHTRFMKQKYNELIESL